MASESQEEKERFFGELDKIQRPSDEEDTSDAAALLRSFRTRRKEPERRPVTSSSAKDKSKTFTSVPKLNRTLSAPSNTSAPSKRSETVSDKETSYTRQPPTLLKHTSPLDKKRSEARGNFASSTSRMPTKRRREKSPKLVPEARRVFKDLVFFFIPNNDIAQPRRIRINKAREYGAVRAQYWNSKITHVIVDNGLNFDAVMKTIPLESFPPDVVLVNEKYPAECIMFRALTDPLQSRFRVEGSIAAPALGKELPSTGEQPKKGSSANDRDAIQERDETTPPRDFDAEEDQASTKAIAEQRSLERSIRGDPGDLESGRRASDELDEAIGEMKAVADLPLDRDDEEARSSEDSDDNTSEEEHQRKKPKNSKTAQEQLDDWRKNFTCMEKHDGLTRSTNPNARTIEVLDQMASYYDRTNDHWRTTAYRKAISALKEKTEKIITKEQALEIPFIGERLASKIEEIVWTNRLRRLENIDNDANAEVLRIFMKVYQASYAVAQRWVAQGHRTLQDLVEKANLTPNQVVGVEHYEDFITRIPRAEVEAHGKIVQDTIHAVDPDFQVNIGGSFRRGASTSGDIDMIITKPGASLDWMRDLLLDTVIPELFKKGFLKAGLATLSRGHGSKWHGASALPGSTIWRRIDFLLVPWEEIGAALIYFTGNDIFNRSMRLLASKKGMRLNQRGLFKDVMRGPGRVKLNEGVLVEGQDEKRIFEILGVLWRPPEYRNC